MTWVGDRDLARAGAELSSRLPEPLSVFARLAFNYWWSWTPEGPHLFNRIDPYRWQVRRQNPVRLLLEAPVASLAAAAADRDLVSAAERLEERLQRELDRPFTVGSPAHPVAFLCAEYGVHRSLPTYGGGLGILAGDILKEASDLALPLVAVGIFYRQGNFHQRVDTTGWQHEYWVDSDPTRLPAALVTDDEGLPLIVRVPLNGRDVAVQIWRVDVGRVPLYLLDAQLAENRRIDRWITSRLYVGDRKLRLAQYALLGVGAIRALRALGIDPSVVHLNEGHASFAPLELAREEIERGTSVEEALEHARQRTVFTTHTPVPAGNETYTVEELHEVLGDLAKDFGADEPRVLALGRSRPEDEAEPLGLTVLGIRMSRSSNAVSRLHGSVARLMWSHLFPGQPVEKVPIGHVTNGVHLPTWMSGWMQQLLDRHLPEGWYGRADDPRAWEAVDDIPAAELWEVRCRMREELVDYVRDRSCGDRLARGEPVAYAEAGSRAFDPNTLTIGFARRVAAYKRLGLLIHDLDRALKLLHGDTPVQLVFAGKAHSSDEEAKRILQQVFQARWAGADGNRAVFLEDYDMGMALHLVAGCDVWLNVPRPPLEASGTSGMKSALNGGLNLSILDGWWEEAYDGSNGWAIAGEETADVGAQDANDAGALYDLLEREVVPLFYDRDPDGIPKGWVERVKRSLRTNGPGYCATRMMREYTRSVYLLD